MKTTNVFIRLEPQLKEQAEIILEQLGVPMSSAVTMFLKQVVLHQGIPFDVKIPSKKPIGLSGLTESELNAELEKGYSEMIKGKVKKADFTIAEDNTTYKL